MDLDVILQRALGGNGCTREEALWLASAVDFAALMRGATALRERFFGKQIEFCVIVNARSGACSEDCRYCSQSAHHCSEVEVYDLLTRAELEQDAAAHALSGACRYGVVTSGATVGGGELDELCDSLQGIQNKSDMGLCASLGRFSVENLLKLKAAGLERYHHNLETSERFYPSICTTHTWQERVDTVRAAQEAGLSVCSGGLFGLGEEWEDRVDMFLTLRALHVECVPLNFLHSHPGTPLADQLPLSADEALRIIAVCRFLLPAAGIRICGGRPKILGARQAEMFAAGANALMTGDYLTTSGITPETDRAMVAGLGLELVETKKN